MVQLAVLSSVLLSVLLSVHSFVCPTCLTLQQQTCSTHCYSAPSEVDDASKVQWSKPSKPVSEKHQEYLDEAEANRKRAAARYVVNELFTTLPFSWRHLLHNATLVRDVNLLLLSPDDRSRLKNSKKFWKKKVVYDFVRTQQRTVAREDNAATRWERNVTMPLASLQQGQWLPGKVRNLESFGAWVDIDAERDGLLHVSDMSEGFTARAEDAVRTGDVLNVTVKFVDAAANKLALSLVPAELTGGAAGKQTAQRAAGGGVLSCEPLENVEAGDELWGEVTKVTNFGAFVEVGVDVQGWLHITEWPGSQGKAPAEVFTRGQRLRTYALAVDVQSSRLKLTGERPDYLPAVGGGSRMIGRDSEGGDSDDADY